MTLQLRLIQENGNRCHAALLYFDISSDLHVRTFEGFIIVITKVQNRVLITGLQI